MRHKVPVHLETPDILLFGMTARQTLILALGLTLAYITVSGVGENPVLLGAAIALAIGIVLAALLVAFLRPKKRSLDVWAMVILTFWMLPKCYAWRPLPPERTLKTRRRAKDDDEDERDV